MKNKLNRFADSILVFSLFVLPGCIGGFFYLIRLNIEFGYEENSKKLKSFFVKGRYKKYVWELLPFLIVFLLGTIWSLIEDFGWRDLVFLLILAGSVSATVRYFRLKIKKTKEDNAKEIAR